MIVDIRASAHRSFSSGGRNDHRDNKFPNEEDSATASSRASRPSEGKCRGSICRTLSYGKSPGQGTDRSVAFLCCCQLWPSCPQLSTPCDKKLPEKCSIILHFLCRDKKQELVTTLVFLPMHYLKKALRVNG